MNEPAQDTICVASGMLGLARRRMVRRYPFYAHFLARWREKPSEAIATMGVSVSDGHIILAFNPTFVVTYSYPELIGMLLHETHHTSASISPALLEEIAGQLAYLVWAHTVKVVECDVRVQRVYPYAGSITAVHGRGGTNFLPMFDAPLRRQGASRRHSSVHSSVHNPPGWISGSRSPEERSYVR